jgi:hypothetical protein
MIRRLGKLAARHDPRTLRLVNYLTPQLAAPPEKADWTADVKAWPMMKNDELGDCTCAAAGHLIQAWTANAGAMFVPSDYDIVAAYAQVGGYDPDDPSTDGGAVELDVLKYWQTVGIASHKIGAFATVNPLHVRAVMQGVALLEGLYIGLSLPTSAQSQTDAGQPWDDVAGAPGGWGGHAVPIVGYDSGGLTCVTWGALQRMTWAFWTRYCDEAYALVSTDMLTGAGTSPAGFDIETLRTNLAAVRAA